MAAAPPITATTPLTGQELDKAIALVRQALAEGNFAIYGQYAQGVTIVDELKIGVENLFSLWAFSDIRRRVWDRYIAMFPEWEVFKREVSVILDRRALPDGTGITVGWCEGVVRLTKKRVQAFAAQLRLVDEYGRGEVFWAKGVSPIIQKAMERADQAGRALDELLKALLTIVQTTASVLPVAIAVLILGPFLLRAFVAWRKGGATAAAESAASSIEAGRANVWEGTKRAAGAAKFFI